MSRKLPNLVILGFLALQGLALVTGIFRLPGGFPWAMFKGMAPNQYWLEAVAVTADGRELPVPLDQVFPYHAHQNDFSAFDWGPLVSDEKTQTKVAEWIGRWLREQRIPATHVILRWRFLDLANGRTSRSTFLEIELDAPPS